MKVESRNYINSFIELSVDEIETRITTKKEAIIVMDNFSEVIEDLKFFIENIKNT